MEAFLFWDGNCSVGEEVPEKTLLFRVRRERWPNLRIVLLDLIWMFQNGSTLPGEVPI
jgi:hypothetical protein